MNIYLMRHGAADSGYSDAQPSLTEDGRNGVAGTADYITDEGINFDVIISSPKLRALQTAEIVAQAVGYPAQDIIQTETLKPNATPVEAMRFLAGHSDKQSVLAVGHLPSMPRLAATLIGMSSTHPFPNAALYRVSVDTLPPAEAELMLLHSPE